MRRQNANCIISLDRWNGPIDTAVAHAISSLENHFRKVHCLGTKEAGDRLLTRIVQRQRRTFTCSPAVAGHAPRKIDRIGPRAVSATQREVAFPEQ
jgi:hypothetical protein